MDGIDEGGARIWSLSCVENIGVWIMILCCRCDCWQAVGRVSKDDREETKGGEDVASDGPLFGGDRAWVKGFRASINDHRSRVEAGALEPPTRSS